MKKVKVYLCPYGDVFIEVGIEVLKKWLKEPPLPMWIDKKVLEKTYLY